MRFLNKIANFLSEAEKAAKSLERISADIADSTARSTAEYAYKSKEDTFKKLLFYSVGQDVIFMEMALRNAKKHS